MATDESLATTWWPDQSGNADSSRSRRDNLVLVRWALIMACAYLILFSQGKSGPWGLGVIGVFLASNVLLGRLSDELVSAPKFSIGVGALDSVLIGTSLYLAGQLNVELLVLFLGILVLAIAGLRLPTIAMVTLGMTLAYMGMVWAAGNGSPWQTSLLLRAPFLLGAALLYASLADSSTREVKSGQAPSAAVEAIARELTGQLDAIRRCQNAATDGSNVEVRAALEEIAAHNRAMQQKVGAAQAQASEAPGILAARSAA